MTYRLVETLAVRLTRLRQKSEQQSADCENLTYFGALFQPSLSTKGFNNHTDTV